MPKKIFAVTNVKLNSDTFFAAGDEIDTEKFTREQLVQLHESGAVEVRVVDEEPTAEVPAKDDIIDATKDEDLSAGDATEKPVEPVEASTEPPKE